MLCAVLCAALNSYSDGHPAAATLRAENVHANEYGSKLLQEAAKYDLVLTSSEVMNDL